MNVAEITGRVKDVLKNNSIIIITKSGNTYTLDTGTFFVPIKENDIIYAKCNFQHNDTNSKNLILSDNPFVIIPTDSESIKNAFIKANNKRFTYNKAEDLFTVLVDKAGSTEAVSDYLDEISVKYHDKKDNTYLEILKPEVTHLQAINILEHFYKERAIRKLYLLGLTKTDIKNAKLSVNEIHKLCLENPFSITSLKIEKCEQILARQNKTIGLEDKLIAIIVREIERICEAYGHIGIPSWYILKMWPNFVQYYPKLCTHYGIIGELEMIYPKDNYIAETVVAQRISKLINAETTQFGEIKFDNPNLTLEQQQAVIGALNNQISIITGAAGTGKTTVIGEIIHQLTAKGDVEYDVSAFTGKAVARLRKVLQSNKATTLDRLISKYGDRKFEYLIIDEISMVTIELLYRVFKTFTHGFSLILVGDPNQLEPIGQGHFLNAILCTKIVNRFHLTENKRVYNATGGRNLIICNSLNMLDTEVPFEFETGPEFQVINSDNIQVIELILIQLQKALVQADDITIVTTYNEYITNLNKIFQQIFNINTKFSLDSKGRVLTLNDRVTNNSNDYKLNIMNGDSGKIIECDQKFVKVQFEDGTVVKFNTTIKNKNQQENTDQEEDTNPDVSQIDISYAMTGHKMQGSENKYIICWFPSNPVNKGFLNLNFLYTALTRSQVGVYIVGNLEQVKAGISTKPKPRYDKLAQRIINLCPNVKSKEVEKIEFYD